MQVRRQYDYVQPQHVWCMNRDCGYEHDVVSRRDDTTGSDMETARPPTASAVPTFVMAWTRSAQCGHARELGHTAAHTCVCVRVE